MTRLKPPILFLVAIVLAYPISALYADTPEVELWRLDCGTMDIDDISYFSDTHDYEGQSGFLTNGCYLVRNGEQYLLWDTGLSHKWLKNTERVDGWLSTFSTTLIDQLDQLDLTVRNINFISLSHFHGDHIGQAADFADSTLLMSSPDADSIRDNPPGNARKRLAPWFDGVSELVEFTIDHDVFGDGSVIILALPGHTPGHSGLLVRLQETGDVLLSGDLYHYQKEIDTRIVSQWNTSRADTLASMEKFEGLIKNLKPVVIVQHDPEDVDKLARFPRSMK